MKFNKLTTGIILIGAFFIQLIIILYNHITGYAVISGSVNFIVKLVYGTILTFLFGSALIYADLQILNRLDKYFTWHNKPAVRLLSETLGCVLTGAVFGSLLTIFSHSLNPYSDGLIKNIVNNSLITVVVNIIVIVILEAIFFFKRNREASSKAEKLEKENMHIQMETLKNQLNPHFLFNSLNVLSALVEKDQAKAQCFIEEFSSVYRYVLDVFDKPVIELREELSFAKSFLYLQQIRFEDSVITEINVDASKLGRYIPPLAIQTLLENAFKHNKADKENPLRIKIYTDDEFLYVVNNVRFKPGNKASGIGLKNLKKRYKFISGAVPEFKISAEEYKAVLPLIKED